MEDSLNYQDLFSTTRDEDLFVQKPKATNRTEDSAKQVALMSALAENQYGVSPASERDNTAAINYDKIISGGEEEVRDRIAQAKANKQADTVVEMAAKAATPFDGLDAFVDDMRNTYDKHALEEGAVDNVIDQGLSDPTQAQVWQDIENKALENTRDYHAKAAILQSKQQEFADVSHNASWSSLVKNYLATAIPFNELYQNMDITKPEGMANFNLDERFRQQQTALFDLPIDEFKKRVDDFFGYKGDAELDAIVHNPIIDEAVINNLLDPDPQGFVLRAAFDAVTFMPLETVGKLGAKVMNSMKNPVNLIKGLNREMASDVVVQTMDKVEQGLPDGPTSVVSLRNGIDASMPASQQVVKDLSVGVSGDVARKIETRNQVFKHMQENIDTTRLTPEEARAAADYAEQQIAARYKPGHIVDMKLVEHDSVTGLQAFDVFLGKADGTGGFATMNQAVLSAKARGLIDFEVAAKEATTLAQDTSGQWFIRQRADVHELRRGDGHSFIVPSDPKEIKTLGYFADYTNPMGWVSKRTATTSLISNFQKNKMHAVIRREIMPAFEKLKNKDLRDLNKVLTKGLEEEKWYDYHELEHVYEQATGRLPKDHEVDAYYAYVQLHQFDWAIRNKVKYTAMARKGGQQVVAEKIGVNTPGYMITDTTGAEHLAEARIYDVTADLSFSPKSKGGNLTKEGLDEMMVNKDYVMYKLEKPYFDPKGDPVDLIIGKRGDIKAGRLDPVQLGYVEGGHRLYEPHHTFVKQARIGTFSDGGTYILDDVTHVAFKSRKEAAAWAAKREEARLAVKDYKAGGKITEEMLAEKLAATSIKDMSQWERMVANGDIVEDSPFEVLNDGERTLFKGEAGTNPYSMEGISGDPMLDSNRWYGQGNKKYTGRRGDEALMGPDGEKIKTLDPMKSLQQSIENAIQLGAYNDFRTSAIEEWVMKASPFIKADLKSSSFEKIFFNPEFHPGLDAKTVGKLKAEREYVLRQLRTRTIAEEKMNSMMHAVADFTEEVTGINKKAVANVLSKNYAQRVRGFVFDPILGFFNPGQYPLQIQTGIGMAAIDPIKGGKAWRSVYSMLMSLNADEKLVGEIAARQAPVHGMDVGDFKNMMKELHKSGFMEVGSDFIDQGLGQAAVESTAGIGSLSRAWGNFKESGRFFLNRAERFNRSVAYNMAWQMAKEKGFADMATSEAREWTIKKASSLMMDMTAAAKGKMQEGITAIPTQFYQYNLNATQMLFTNLTDFTPKERLRFAIGQAVLYGTTGIVGKGVVDWFGSQYKEMTGTEMNPMVAKTLSHGAIDGFLNTISGGILDTDFSSRASLGSFVEQMRKMWTDGKFLDVLEGVSGNWLFGKDDKPGFVGDVMSNALYIYRATRAGTATKEAYSNALLDVMRNVSVVNSAERAWLAYNAGVIYTRNMTPVARAAILDPLLIAGGIPLAKETETYAMAQMNTVDSKQAKEIAKMIVEINERAGASNDQKVKDAYADQVNILLQSVENPKMKREVLFQASKDTSSSFYMSAASTRLDYDINSPMGNKASRYAREESK